VAGDDESIHTRVLREGTRVVGVRRRYLRISVKSGPQKGERVQLSGDRMLIGTHASCDLVLADSAVSRQHCEIELAARGYIVRDLDSTNGTWADRVRVHSIGFDESLQLRLGDTRLELKVLDEAVELPVAAKTSFGPLIGQSAAMRRVFAQLALLAPSETTVLITGESGTGKELAAQAIHEASPRAAGPFRVVDCGALAPTLIESELFGHVRGAFTGADRSRKGAFESAAGGTLFLDEIGELPLELQSRLLGALERRRVQPVGSTTSTELDVRIVAATNRNLRREVNRGTFREDLFFRLAVAVVKMPALRERPEDIPLYVDALFEGAIRLDPEMLARLQAQRWPGNVRELRNALERAAVLPDEPAVEDHGPTPLSVTVDARVPYKTGKALLLESYDHAYIEDLLRRHANNITQSARAAGLDRVYFLRLLDRLGLRPKR
jgi:DNA-binding NtrC family response regulator